MEIICHHVHEKHRIFPTSIDWLFVMVSAFDFLFGTVNAESVVALTKAGRDLTHWLFKSLHMNGRNGM